MPPLETGRDTPVSLKQILWSFGIVLGVFAVIVFGLYWWKLGLISTDHTAWSSFGSLLSGVFTIVGAGATVGTLLFLGKQNHDMQEVTKAQMATLTFERYTNHRKLFSDHLQELVALHKNAFTFRDPSSLYNAIFPENSPHNCSFAVPPTFDVDGDGENHVGKIMSKMKTLKAYLDLAQFKDDADEFALLLIDLSYSICMIEPAGELRDGDVKFLERFYGFNIYTLDDFVKPCLSICNMILRFTNNPLLDVRAFNSNSRYVREGMMKHFLFPSKRHAMKVVSRIKGIHILAFVFFEAQRLREGTAYLFPDTVKQLNVKFVSADNVNTLADDSVFTDMLNVLLHEVTLKVYEMDKSLDYYNDAVRVNENLIALINRADNF
jgi:hypothetical protein